MIEAGLKFLMLFIDMFFGVTWVLQLLSEEKEKLVSFIKVTACVGIAVGIFVIANLFELTNPFGVGRSIGLLVGIIGISWFLLRYNLKHLISVACFYLGIIHLFDIAVMLLNNEFVGFSRPFPVVILILFKLLLNIGIFIYPGFISSLAKIKPFYSSIYGTPIVGFAGIALLSSLTFASKQKDVIFNLWIVMAVILILRVLLSVSHIRYQKEKEFIATIEMQKSLLEKNYAAVNRAYSVNARLFHDFHKQLEILQQMALKRKDIDMMDYIETLSSPLKEIASVIWTGDETLDYIINSRYSKAKENGIEMEINIEFPYNTNIRSNDLCTILSNLLDNALESCQRSGRLTGCRVYLAIRRIQNILVIKLENTSLEPEYNSNLELNTSKKDGTLHGFGMKNIETAVLKYDGMIQTSYAEDIFSSIVTLSFDGVEIN